jgi:ribose 5-phosphate isomerase RpiB
MLKIYIASDHAGFELKEALTGFLHEHGVEVEDCGAFESNSQATTTPTIFCRWPQKWLKIRVLSV